MPSVRSVFRISRSISTFSPRSSAGCASRSSSMSATLLELVRERLALAVVDRVRNVGPVEQLGEVEPLLLPVVLTALLDVEELDAADHLVDAAEAELGHELAQLLARSTGGTERRSPACRRSACAAPDPGSRCRPGRCSGGRRASGCSRARPAAPVEKPNSSAPSSAAIATSRPVLRPPSVCTRMRPRRSFSTSVCCVSASPISHGMPACLIDASGDAPVPPSMPLISTPSALPLATPAAIVPTPLTDDELHADARAAVGVLQVVDQLREVLDRVDVVVRRRRDQADARRRVAHARDRLVDLVAGQLAALAGLRALRDLDLQSRRS